ncbi:clpB2 [Symbiodinium sp. CCMP2592]|nr:clpB2 [Symbiodinium sp. CCMP2592]
MEKLVESWGSDASHELHVLWRTVGTLHALGGRRVSDLVWPEEMETPNFTVEQATAVAAVAPRLALPADCRKDLARLLLALAADPRKQEDVRDLRLALKVPEAVTALKLRDHPGCGILQLALAFKFVQGRFYDVVLDPSAINDALLGILIGHGVLKEACHVHWERTMVKRRQGSLCWVSIRTQSAESADALKQAFKSCKLEKKLEEVKIDELLLNAPVQVAYHEREGNSDTNLRFDRAFFCFSLEEIRVTGGRILDIIDPSRASIDPMCEDETCFPPEAPEKDTAGVSGWNIPPIRAWGLGNGGHGGRGETSEPPASSAGAPRWIPTVLAPAPEAGLRLASEVSGIPWMGPRTVCNPLYQRLGELLTAMRPLFARLAPQDGSSEAALHQRLDATSKVLIKAQVYEVHSCEEILGELHREGIKRDQIQMVGLYYPIVDEGLAGGDLEITVVLTGGCGSQYPKSKTIAVQAGTAIVFDNHTVYHRMTALRAASASSGQRGRRLVVAFFVLQGGEVPGTDCISVNYADKARVLVRRTLRKLPKHVQFSIEQFLTGGTSYARQRFESSRRARARDLTQQCLIVSAVD